MYINVINYVKGMLHYIYIFIYILYRFVKIFIASYEKFISINYKINKTLYGNFLSLTIAKDYLKVVDTFKFCIIYANSVGHNKQNIYPKEDIAERYFQVFFNLCTLMLCTSFVLKKN